MKDLVAKHFPDVSSSSSDGDDAKWLESILENLKQQLVSNKSSRSNTSTNSNSSPIANNNNVTNNNHLNSCSEVEKNNLNNNAVNGDSNSSTSSAAENEIVLLQNAQLKTTVEEYKNIIAETVSFYWQLMEIEIDDLENFLKLFLKLPAEVFIQKWFLCGKIDLLSDKNWRLESDLRESFGCRVGNRSFINLFVNTLNELWLQDFPFNSCGKFWILF